MRTLTLLLVALLAVLNLSVFLDTVPGLQGDEAWSGLRAHEIAHGLRPMNGLTPYTGPQQQYLLAPLCELFGYRVWVLRALTVAATLVALALIVHLTWIAFGADAALATALLLVTLPAFIAFGRFATENFALNPLLAALAAFLARGAALAGGRRGGLLAAAGAGLCLGLGLTNHFVFAPAVAAMAAWLLVARGVRVVRDRRVLIGGAAFLVALAPAIVSALAQRAGGSLSGRLHDIVFGLPEIPAPGIAGRLQQWPAIFSALAHGDLLFRLFAGELRFASQNLIAPLAVAALGFLAWRSARAPRGERWRFAAAPALLIVLLAAQLLISPGNNDSYFLLPLLALPVMLGAAAGAIASGTSARRALVLGGIVVLALWNEARVVVNYFGAQLASGGKAALVLVGEQPFSSNRFVRTDRLYQELSGAGAFDVLAEYWILEPLRFHDLDRNRIRASWTQEALEPGATLELPARLNLVVYHGEGGLMPAELLQMLPLEPGHQDEHFLRYRTTRNVVLEIPPAASR